MSPPPDKGAMERAAEEYDPQIARLPHPYRYSAANMRAAKKAGYKFGAEELDAMLLGGRDTYRALVALLAHEPLNARVIDRLARTDAAFRRFVQLSMATPGATYEGQIWWYLAYLRWLHGGRHFFQTTTVLDEMLVATDVGSGIPARYVTPPYAAQFIQFGENMSSPLTIPHALSGEHVLEGCYVQSGIVPHDALGAGKRFIEFVFTGSPLGKANNTDDANSSITLLVPSETATIDEVLEHSYSLSSDGNVARAAKESEPIRPAIYHAAKVLLYLNSDRVIRENVTERSDLAARLARAGAGKAGKIERQMERAYDRIVIGPRKVALPAASAGPTGRAMPMHWLWNPPQCGSS